jgi:hypothetical protein
MEQKKEIEKLYIVDPINFKGSIKSTVYNIPSTPLDDRLVHYTNKTFKRYNEEHDGVLVAVNCDEFMSIYYNPYLLSLQGKFEETTKEFMDGLECIPPKMWRRIRKQYQTFFVGEPYTHNIHRCYVQKGNKFYTAYRSTDTDLEDLINLKDKVAAATENHCR